MKCDDCMYWVRNPDEGGAPFFVNNMQLGNIGESVPSGNTPITKSRNGQCRRFPSFVERDKEDWCGEFRQPSIYAEQKYGK